MKYNHKDASDVIPAGVYEASIHSVDTTDKDGKPLRTRDGVYEMQKVTFEVYVGDAARKVWVYFAASPKALFRYRMLAKAIGQSEAFKADTFNAMDHIGANLRVELSIEDSPQYGEQNRVDDFQPSTVTAKREPSRMEKAATAKATDVDDSIPF